MSSFFYVRSVVLKKWCLSLLILSASLPVSAPCWFYTKFGTELGVGFRMHGCKHGFDLSVNGTTVIVQSWIDAKLLYLNYPFQKPFYCGFGPGVLHNVAFVIAGPYRGTNHTTTVSAETVLGYEFCLHKNRFFFQVEGSIPFSNQAGFPIIPALVFGIEI